MTIRRQDRPKNDGTPLGNKHVFKHLFKALYLVTKILNCLFDDTQLLQYVLYNKTILLTLFFIFRLIVFVQMYQKAYNEDDIHGIAEVMMFYSHHHYFTQYLVM